MKESMFWVTALKMLGRVGTHILFLDFFMHFERYFTFQNAIFSRKPEQFLCFTSKFRQSRVTLYTGYFLFGLTCGSADDSQLRELFSSW